MIALSWILWLSVVALQAIIHFCLMGKSKRKHSSVVSWQEENISSERKEKQEKQGENEDESMSSKYHEWHSIKREGKFNKKDGLVWRRRVKSDVSINDSSPELDYNYTISKRILKECTTDSTEESNDDTYLEEEEHPKVTIIARNESHEQEQQQQKEEEVEEEDDHHYESDLDDDDEDEWRLALIHRYEENKNYPSKVSINMLHRSNYSASQHYFDQADSYEEDHDVHDMNSTVSAYVEMHSAASQTSPLVCA